MEEEIFERVRYSERPERFEYKLTRKGLDLYPVLLALMEWGDRYKVDDPPVRLFHKACGAEARAAPGVRPLRGAGRLRRPARRVRAGSLVTALVGGTVADVYTGTWVEANVEFDDGVITYVGPREPACAAIDISGKVLVPGYIEPHTHPWCLYSPTSLLEVAVPDGTTTLVYDNLFFFLSHGVDGLRTIVDAMHAAPAHIRWVARISPQSAYPDEAERFAIERDRPDALWPEVVASGEITNWMSVAKGEPRVAAGIAAAKAARRRVEGHNAGASYNRLNELSRGRDLRRSRGDHGRGGARAAAAGHVDDAAPVLAAAGSGGDAARAARGGRPRAAADVHDRRRRRRPSTPSAA